MKYNPNRGLTKAQIRAKEKAQQKKAKELLEAIYGNQER